MQFLYWAFLYLWIGVGSLPNERKGYKTCCKGDLHSRRSDHLMLWIHLEAKCLFIYLQLCWLSLSSWLLQVYMSSPSSFFKCKLTSLCLQHILFRDFIIRGQEVGSERCGSSECMFPCYFRGVFHLAFLTLWDSWNGIFLLSSMCFEISSKIVFLVNGCYIYFRKELEQHAWKVRGIESRNPLVPVVFDLERFTRLSIVSVLETTGNRFL